jgi:subtilisin family serine protease
MTSIFTNTKDLSGSTTTGNVYVPQGYLTNYVNTSTSGVKTFIFGSIGDANISLPASTADGATGFHQLYTLQVAGLSSSYTVSSLNGLVTLTNIYNGQNIQFQLTEPTAGANNSGVDVQFMDGGVAFTSNLSNGSWTTWVTKGGATTVWGSSGSSDALPATGTQSALSLANLNTNTLNSGDSLTTPQASGYSQWSSTTGLGVANVDMALLDLGIKYTHVNPPVPNATKNFDWGIGAMNFQDAWSAQDANGNSLNGQGITIAAIDTGIDQNNTHITSLPVSTNVFSTVYDTSSSGHGTLVASMMTAQPYNTSNPTATPIVGGAWGASLLSLNYNAYVGNYTPTNITLYDSLTNTAPNSTAPAVQNSFAAGIYYAVDSGARIINMSAGSPLNTEIQQALQYADNQGAIVVLSSGNEGMSAPTFPASSATTIGNVIAVGSTQYMVSGATYQGTTQTSTSSQAGSSAVYDYLDAPGANVLAYGIGSTSNTAVVTSGTSFAAPLISAELAIVEQAILASSPNISAQVLSAVAIHDVSIGLVGVQPWWYTGSATANNPYL